MQSFNQSSNQSITQKDRAWEAEMKRLAVGSRSIQRSLMRQSHFSDASCTYRAASRLTLRCQSIAAREKTMKEYDCTPKVPAERKDGKGRKLVMIFDITMRTQPRGCTHVWIDSAEIPGLHCVARETLAPKEQSSVQLSQSRG